jgi:hypothetical protein
MEPDKISGKDMSRVLDHLPLHSIIGPVNLWRAHPNPEFSTS